MNSDILEEWAKNELKNLDSEINQRAFQLRQKLEDYYKIPVYYNIWEENSTHGGICPLCNNPGETSNRKYPDFMCRQCRILF